MQTDDLLPYARGLCAALAELDGNWKPAENYRAGLMDDSDKVRATLDWLRFAMTESIPAS